MMNISPIAKKDRIQVIDILRGMALLGILLVNVHEVSSSWYVTDVSGTTIDRFTQILTDIFFLNKFYTLFSFLFGLGMSIQMIRAEDKGVPFVALYLRRLFWLLVFGLLHAILIWDGDILATYALLGLFLVLLRKLSPKILIVLSIILIVINIGIQVADLGVDTEESRAAEYQNYKTERQENIDFFRNASYREITAYRFESTLDFDSAWLILLAPFYVLSLGTDVLGIFLFGLAVGKLGWFDEIDDKLPLWRNILRWGLPIGLVVSIAGGALVYLGTVDIANAGLFDIGMILVQAGAPPLTLGYVSGVVLLSRRTSWLGVFAPIGKTALTVYLTQSIVLTLIFYSYGLKLYGSVGPAMAWLLALVIYGLQMLVSTVWMRYFRFGPAEWLWRSLTYRKFQPMRI